MTDKSKAIIFMLFSAAGFSVMQTLVKLTTGIPVYEKVFFRNLISLIIAFFICKKNGSRIMGTSTNRPFLFYRSILGSVGMVLYFFAISKMFLADSTIINKTSPFFLTIFAVLFLKEKLHKIQIPALIIVLIAVFLVVKPQFNLSMIPATAAFFSSICAAAAYTFVRFLGKREKPETIIFFFSLTNTILMIIPMLLRFTMPNSQQIILLFFTGIFAAIGQFGLTHAYKLAPASEIAIYNYINILFAFVIGIVIWHEIPDVYSIIGGIIIIAISVILFFYHKNNNLKLRIKNF